MTSRASRRSGDRVDHDPLPALDGPSKIELEDLCQLAALACDAPAAFVSLFDGEIFRFLSSYGIDLPSANALASFARHASEHPGNYQVYDLAPLRGIEEAPLSIGESPIRSFIRIDARQGSKLVCSIFVADVDPRGFQIEQIHWLEAIAASAISVIERSWADPPGPFLGRVQSAVLRLTSVASGQKFSAYLFAAALVLTVGLFKGGLEFFTHVESPFVLFFGAILLSAWRGGIGPGLFATVTASAIAYYFFLPHVGHAGSESGPGLRVALFLGEGVVASLLCESRLRVIRSAEQDRELLEQRVKRRTAELSKANYLLQEKVEHDAELQQMLAEAPRSGARIH